MNVKYDFQEQNFVVTGASSGIGQETARELLQAGARVLGLARHFDACTALAEEFPHTWMPVETDITDSDAAVRAIEAFTSRYGKVHGCVHSAGISTLQPINVWTVDKAREIMELNLWAGESMLKLLLKRKYRAEQLSHVFISSISAHEGQKGMSAYSTSKGAVEVLVRCAAQELAAKGQRVNSVCLGWIAGTRMTSDVDNTVPEAPLGNGEPADAAGMILFLLSDRARWITGANFVLDGGYLA